jgi:hypothetical protein
VEFVTIGLGEKQVSSNSSETTVPFGSVQVYLILKKENLTAVTAAVHLTAALVSEHIAQIAAESFPAKQRNAVIRFMLNYRNVLILYEQTS